jgi:hypothetical protein
MAYQPDPDRDRQEASRLHQGSRQPLPVGKLVGDWCRSPEYRRLQRLRKVRLALIEVLGEDLAARVQPVAFGSTGLTLEVADGMLLAELRNHIHHELLGALADHGVGTQEIRYRLRRS